MSVNHILYFLLFIYTLSLALFWVCQNYIFTRRGKYFKRQQEVFNLIIEQKGILQILADPQTLVALVWACVVQVGFVIKLWYLHQQVEKDMAKIITSSKRIIKHPEIFGTFRTKEYLKTLARNGDIHLQSLMELENEYGVVTKKMSLYQEFFKTLTED